MTFNGGDFTVGSNVFLFLSVLWLIYVRLDARYALQIMLLLTSMFASINYHLCFTHSLAWCAGGGSEDPRAVSMARDIMAAFQALGVAGILIDQWWMGRKGTKLSEHVFAWFCIVSMIGTFFCVVQWSDGSETIIATSIWWGFFTCVAHFNDRHAKDASKWTWWTWTRLAMGAACMAAAAGVRAGAIQQYIPDATQSDEYDLLHGMTHCLFGLASLLFVSLVGKRAIEPAYKQVPAKP